jgi:hypothetical protein
MMVQEGRESTAILHEIETLCIMHEKITRSSECREFNRRTALLLQKLEDAGFNRLADRAMDLLGPPAIPRTSPSGDSIQRARDALERLRDLARENLETEKG